MRLPLSAIALPILAASVLLAPGCQDANEGARPDLKATPEPGVKTTYSSYGEAMLEKADQAAKNKPAAKDKAAPAPAKTPADQPKS
jgi:hypothetical protein